MSLRRIVGAGVAALAVVLGCGANERPNVLLVTLDTTRVDRLGLYGHGRDTSPNLDELAAESIVFDNAYSTSSWTLPAHASLFTGKYPTSHGVQHDPEGDLVLAEAIDVPDTLRARSLPPAEPTLAGRLAAAGYATGAVVAGPWLLSVFGLSSGFEFYDDSGIHDEGGRSAQAVTDSAISWLGQLDREPFFLFLNYFDPHAPYQPPRRFLRRFASPEEAAGDPVSFLLSAYDAEISYMDFHLGRLFRYLSESGLYDGTLVVVTGDHGEAFGEHRYWRHERYLWQELVRVPLIVKSVEGTERPRREPRLVSLVDVPALILDRVGLPLLAGQGQLPGGSREAILAEVNPVHPTGKTGHWRAFWFDRYKYLWTEEGQELLFDLKSDQEELRSLVSSRPRLAASVRRRALQAFEEMPRPDGTPEPGIVSDETREALERMGYLEPGSP